MSSDSTPSLLRRCGRALKGLVLWHYERGSWQYDVMVGLILAFVFLTPTRFFHDKPVYGRQLTSDIVRMDADEQGVRYRVSADLLASYDPDPQRAAQEVFQRNLGHAVTLTRILPIEAEGGVVVWYDVWVRE